MTFLEYVCEKLMGPPLYRSCGRSYWPCPACDNQTAFSTLPHNPEYKDRCICFRCTFRGDEADVLQHYRRGQSWPRRRAQLEAWKREYDAREAAEAEAAKVEAAEAAAIPTRGLGIRKPPVRTSEDWLKLGLAWANFLDDLRERKTSHAVGLQIIGQFKQRCDENSVSMEGLLAYWLEFEDWKFGLDQAHLVQCQDEECDAAVCRVARGLLPVTEEEIRAERKEREEERRKRLEKVRTFIQPRRSSGSAKPGSSKVKGGANSRSTGPKASVGPGKVPTKVPGTPATKQPPTQAPQSGHRKCLPKPCLGLGKRRKS